MLITGAITVKISTDVGRFFNSLRTLIVRRGNRRIVRRVTADTPARQVDMIFASHHGTDS